MKDEVEEVSEKIQLAQIEIERLRGELNTKDQQVRNYAIERAEKARNQAIGVFSFIALLGALGLWAAIGPLVEGAVEESAIGQALRDATESSSRAEIAANSAEALLSEIEDSIEVERSEREGVFDELVLSFKELHGEIMETQDGEFSSLFSTFEQNRADLEAEFEAFIASLRGRASGEIQEQLVSATTLVDEISEMRERYQSLIGEAIRSLESIEENEMEEILVRLSVLEERSRVLSTLLMRPSDISRDQVIGLNVFTYQGDNLGQVKSAHWESLEILWLRLEPDSKFHIRSALISSRDFDIVAGLEDRNRLDIFVHNVPEWAAPYSR